MGMGRLFSISVAFGRLQGRYPGGKVYFTLFCFASALRGNLGFLGLCVEMRERRNECMSMYAERVFGWPG